MWPEFGEFGGVVLMGLEILAGLFLLWFLWSIGSDVWHVFRHHK
jgi:hypothetical protein